MSIASTALELVKSANAQNVIFSDKSSQVEELTGRGDGQTSLIAPKPSLKPKDFYWDQIVVIVVSAILGLTVLDIAVEFFQRSGVQCYTPASVEVLDDFTRDRAAFVNNYCYESLSPSEYFPVYILAHGLALIAPHYLWRSLFGGYFDFFFDLVKDLNRLRNIKTGEYEAQDFEIVKKLEREYRRKSIFYTYILKLGVQFIFALFSFVFGIAYFRSFSPSFTCPRNADLTGGELANGWPLNSTITCVYSSLRFLGVIRFVDHTLVGIAAVATLVGLAWCFLRHPAELGYRDIAKFVGDSCFLPENYVPKPFHESPRQPRIKNDMDFLLLMLFRTDTGHGKVFKEIQIQKEVDIHNKRDHELLQLFRTAQSEMGLEDRGRTSEPHRIHDVHMFFKDRGFKGTPRHDVFRMFSPRFGITKRKSCNEPLDEEEVKKVADEMARFGSGRRDAIIAVMEGLGCPEARSKLSESTIAKSDIDGLEGELYHLLSKCLRDSDSEATGLGQRNGSSQRSTSESLPVTTESQRIPFRKKLAGKLKSSDSPQLKLIGDGVYYGELKKKPEKEAEFINRIHGFIQFAPGNTFAMDISFGSTGCAYILAWAFQEVASVNFDQYLQDPHQEAFGKFFSNVTTMRFPPDIFVQKTDTALTLGEALNRVFYGEGVVGEHNKQNDTHRTCTDFIVVGPIDHKSKKVTVNLLIDRLHQDSSIHKEAVLLAIRPLWIGKKDTSKRFIQYVPPPDLFKRICVNNDEEHQKLEHQIGRASIRSVEVKRDEELIMTEEDLIQDHPEDETVSREKLGVSKTTTVYGIEATCGDARCLFEFAVYRYTVAKQPERAQGSVLPQPHTRDKNAKKPPKQAKPADVNIPIVGVLRLIPDAGREELERATQDPGLSSPQASSQPTTTTMEQGDHSHQTAGTPDNDAHSVPHRGASIVHFSSDRTGLRNRKSTSTVRTMSTEVSELASAEQSLSTNNSQTNELSDDLSLRNTGRQSSTESFVSANLETAVNGGDDGHSDGGGGGGGGDDGDGHSDGGGGGGDGGGGDGHSDGGGIGGDGGGGGDGYEPIQKVEMTEEEEYWFQIAQGGISADGWKPPSRTPTDYSSDDEPAVTSQSSRVTGTNNATGTTQATHVVIPMNGYHSTDV